MSNRKPYNELSGYKCSLRNKINGGHVVIYDAKEQGIDVAPDRWAVVCEMHHTMLGVSSVKKGRPFLKYPEFCEECMKDYKR